MLKDLMALVKYVITKNLPVFSQVRETNQMKHLDITGESKKEFMRLKEDKQHLQEQVEVGVRLSAN